MRVTAILSALLSLFIAVVVGCAKIEAPTGGPRDLTPPYIIAVTPDTFAILEAGEHTIRFEFSERISQTPVGGGELDQAVQISPQTGAIEVKHGRRSLEVKMEGGFLPGRVYRITVLPVVQDMFQNPLRNPFELIVSTGPPFQPTILAAVITDWMSGAPVADAILEARSAEAVSDSFPYLARSDEHGIAIFRYLPEGVYEVQAYLDLRRNATADYAEPQAATQAIVEGTDTLILDMELLLPDTIPARLLRADFVDSFTIRVSFDDFVSPDVDFSAVRVDLEQDTITWEVLGAISEADWISSQEAAVAAAAEAAAAVAGVDPPDPVESGAAEAPQSLGHSDGLVRSFVVRLSAPLRPGEDYLVRVTGLLNLNGVPGGGGEAIFTVPDSSTAPPTGAPRGAALRAPFPVEFGPNG